MAGSESGQARMDVDLTADDYADFAAYVYKRPELRRRRYRSHLRFAIFMIVALLAYLVWQTWDGRGPGWGVCRRVFQRAGRGDWASSGAARWPTSTARRS